MEVVRVGGGLEDNMAGGDEPENNQDTEFQDRKLVCMVKQTNLNLHCCLLAGYN